MERPRLALRHIILLAMIDMEGLVHMVWGHLVLSAINLFRGMVLISTDPARVDGGGHAVAT